MSALRIIRRIKQSFLDLQIRKKLLLSFAALIAVPVTLMAVFYLTNSKIILENKSSHYTSDILAELRKNIENISIGLNSAYVQLANNEPLQEELLEINQPGWAPPINPDGSHVDSALRDILYSHTYIESIYIIPYQNTARFYSVPQGASPNASASDLSLIDARQDQQGTWLKVDHGTVTYGQVIYSTQNLAPLGYVIINLAEEKLFDIYSDISLYKDGSIFITDGGGYILSHGDKSLLDTQVSADYLQLILTPSDTPFSRQSLNGVSYYIACQKLNNGQWYMFYQVDAFEFEKDFIMLTQAFFVITIVILILALTVAVFLAKSISGPISKLSSTMQQVRNGNFGIRNDYHAKDEVGALSDSFNAMIENTNELIETIYQKELLKQQAELKFLQFQINPHFLYNTLETINWISRIRGVPEAGEIAKALGDLMREGLRDDDFVPIEREVRNVENYLLIQKCRFGEKIQSNTYIDPTIAQVRTPKFILQPIIENAILHGIDPKLEGGTIRIFGGHDGEDIVLTIEDDGVGMPPDMLRNLLNENIRKANNDGKHTHIGILNVHKRLQLTFGPTYGLTIHSEVGVGTVVTIRLPYGGSELESNN